MLTQARVKELFDYVDGDLIRKVRTSNCINIGDVAGGPDTHGYLQTTVDGRRRLNHRIIWLWHHGYTPEGMIDHRDQDHRNNRIDNLREVSRMCNMLNSKQQNSSSGVKGVYWRKDTRKWRAQVVYGTKAHLGSFKDFTEAVCHRLAAEQCLNWGVCDDNSPAYQYVAAWRAEIKTDDKNKQ